MPNSQDNKDNTDEIRFAIALHGGAGVISKSLEYSLRHGYEAGLEQALRVGVDILKNGGTSLDAVEAVVRELEDNPLFNAGKGSVFTHEGDHELDASIMYGKNLGCGAVSGVKTVKNPITLARRVMELTEHVYLAGEGAEAFADELVAKAKDPTIVRVTPEYFHTERRYAQYLHALKKDQVQLDNSPEEAHDKDAEHKKHAGGATAASATTVKTSANDRTTANNNKMGTVGCVACDRFGNVAAATSTGGMTNKRKGRVGDSPIIGAGTYANNKTCAVSATGHGEKFIRNCVAHDISAIMEYTGASLHDAAHLVVHKKLDVDDGGIIAVSPQYEICMMFNSEGMFRACADHTGRHEVKIWE